MKIVFVADNRNRENWGCRATSIALKEMISQNHEIIYTIYGDITLQYKVSSQLNSKGFFVKILDKLCYKRGIKYIFNFFGYGDFISENVNKSLIKFNKKCLHKTSIYSIIEKKINEADALVVNGEGTFIFSTPYRRDTIFYLLLLKKAQLLNKKTYCLNSIFSDCPQTKLNEFVLNQTISIFNKCDLITFRDKLSFEKYKSINPLNNYKFIPDALFTWDTFINYQNILKYPKALITFPENEILWESLDFTKPYICIGGSSSAAKKSSNKVVESYISLVQEIQKIGLQIVIVSTCVGDSFLQKVAIETNNLFIPVNTNILCGMAILSNACVFISGRWHPSILASIGGTPCVMLSSNSHKTKSYLDLLDYSNTIEYSDMPNKFEIQEIRKLTNEYIENNNEYRKKIKLKHKELSILANKHIYFNEI